MYRGLGVSRSLLGLVLALTCLGCRNLGAHRASPPAPLRTDGPPAPSLQIPETPVSAAPQVPANPLESPPLFASMPPAPPAATNPLPPPTQVASVAPPGALAALGTPGSQPAAPPALPPAETVSPLRRLAQDAAAAYASFDAYSARLRQREQVNGKDRPEEVMLVKFRKQPWSVYFKWVGPEAQGREVVYVQGGNDGKIHTRLAAGDVLLMPAGARFSVAPDSALARGRSRHPITEAGIGTLVERFGRLIVAAERGDGRLAYLGKQARPEFAAPVEVVEQAIAPGAEPALPRGGRRQWFFAADSHLPVLTIARDEIGHEVEYYCYDQLQYPARFAADDFNPDRLWAKR
jgi:hypothetical protein